MSGSLGESSSIANPHGIKRRGGGGAQERDRVGKARSITGSRCGTRASSPEGTPGPGGPPHQAEAPAAGHLPRLLEQVESALHFASGMLVAAAGGDFDAFQVDLAGFPDEAHAFQRLAAVKVSGCIVGVSRHKGTEFGDGGFEEAGIAILHGQTVAREAIGGVRVHHALEDIQTGTWHACATIPCEMACPYFYPVEARAGSAMLPLGDWWKGVCHAVPGAPEEAGGTGCDTACNMGYARGACARFPEGPGPDAVRFTISSHESGVIGIYYAVERDHHPFAQGRLEYSPAANAWVTPPETALLARQAEAYVESYLRRKKESRWKQNR